METALLALGLALQPLAGMKSLLLFGSQIGMWTGHTTTYYELGRRALGEAGVSVFCLDISDGEHRLAWTLQRLADETGGLYMPTYEFPGFAMRTVERALSGYYVLVFRKPPGSPGEHTIRIRLAHREGTVRHRRFYDDRE